MSGRRTSTEDYIAALANAPVPRPFAPAATVLCVIAATGLGIVGWVALMGVRPDLGPALIAPITLAKTLLPLVLALGALHLAVNSAYPGARLRPGYLLIPLGIALVMAVATAFDTPSPHLLSTIVGETAVKCITAVVTLSLLPIAAGTIFLRRGASTSPTVTGGLLGLAAGAGAATGYSLACTQDSPLFYVVWYGLAILCAGCIGALVGSRLLRW